MKSILQDQLAHYSGKDVPIIDYDEAFSPFEIENISLTKQQTTMDVNWLSLNGFSIIQRETHEDTLQYGRSVENAFTLRL